VSSDKVGTQLKKRERLVQRVRSVYRDAVSRAWDQKTLSLKLNEVRETEEHATQWVWAHLTAVEQELFHQLFTPRWPGDTAPLVYAYDYEGRRLLLGSAEYHEVRPSDLSEKFTWSGYVWRHRPDRAFRGEVRDGKLGSVTAGGS
jgi:hypothetical protein